MATQSRRATKTTRAKAGARGGGRRTSKASGRATLTTGEVMRAVRKVRAAMELFDAQAPEVDQILKVVEQVAGRADRLESKAAVTLPEILWTFPGRQYRMSVALRRLR